MGYVTDIFGYVFYDEEQNIFQRNFGEAFLIPGEPYLLRRNLRNTKNIWDFVIADTELGSCSYSTQIELLDSAIALRATKTEMNTAIRNIKVGGKNLLLDSALNYDVATYNAGSFYLGSDIPAVGEQVTVRLWAKLGSDRTRFMNPVFSVISIVLIALEYMYVLLALAAVLFILWLVISHKNK